MASGQNLILASLIINNNMAVTRPSGPKGP
jgi:hypothetical protein